MSDQLPEPRPTRREEPSPEPTRRDGSRSSGGPSDTRREGQGAYVRTNLPPDLAERYEVLSEIGSGGESDVLLVRRRSDGAESALKLYRRGLELNKDLLAEIQTLPREHVVEIIEFGESADGSWWEEQEYLKQGSLADLFLAEGPRLQATRLRDIIVEMTTALEAVHPVLFHRDVKPTNVFVRSGTPLDLVLGDFGLARDTSHMFSSRRPGTLAYESPEALAGAASPARDWWALGMIVAEAAMGRHPFSDSALGMPSEREIEHALMTRPVPLDIEDDRIDLLCRGLLTRDPEHRWKASEVRSWLEGDSPQVIGGQSSSPGVARTPGVTQPLFFAGERCHTPRELAPILAQNWSDALRLISGAASEAPEYIRLVEWLEDHRDEAALRVLTGGHDRNYARRLFRLLRVLDPELPPSFRGYVIDRSGLLDTASAAARGDQAAGAALEDILIAGILGDLAREDAFADLIGLDEQWRAQVDVLTRVAGETGASESIALGSDAGRAARALLLLTLLDTGELARLAEQLNMRRQQSDLPAHDPRTSDVAAVVGSGNEPARLIVGLLVCERLADTISRERAEEVAHETELRLQRAEAERLERQRVEQTARSARDASRTRAARAVGEVVGMVLIPGVGATVVFLATSFWLRPQLESLGPHAKDWSQVQTTLHQFAPARPLAFVVALGLVALGSAFYAGQRSWSPNAIYVLGALVSVLGIGACFAPGLVAMMCGMAFETGILTGWLKALAIILFLAGAIGLVALLGALFLATQVIRFAFRALVG